MPASDDIDRFGERESIAKLGSRLLADIRAMVGAEIAVYQVEVGRRGASAGRAAAMFLTAITLVGSALTALLVGLTIWVGQALGMGWALLIVIGSSVVLAALLAWFGLGAVKNTIDPDRAR